MRKREDLLHTLEAIHAAGLDDTLWPNALSSMSRLFGSIGTTLERVDKQAGQLTDFWSHGVPEGSELEYADHYIITGPRMALADPRRFGEIGYDYMLLDEAAMDRNPYYSEFLPKGDMRYFISGALLRNDEENAAIAVQRSARQGHVGEIEIKLMQSLLPHLQRAYDATRRLRGSAQSQRMLEDAFDWLSDGVLLIGQDGLVLFANSSAQAFARRGDGIRIVRGRIEFSLSSAAGSYDRALAAVQRLKEGLDNLLPAEDFHVPGPVGIASYVVSVRPMPAAVDRTRHANAVALVFMRPISKNPEGLLLARVAFSLTDAEADLARALVEGTSLKLYASRKRLSMNTIYTHLRHIKAKTGSQRMPELVGKLSAYRAPLGQTREPR
jgi:DNA-binding CsgD family transcriptional regulator